ncbi:MAG: ABC transporter permease [Acidobacteria bacterium]|nr:ABC transporter permease [Acidobacteriota bacterium]
MESMLRLLPLIFKNTLRSKRRSILTVLSVTMSFTLLGVLFAMYNAFYFSDPTAAQALRLITRNRISLTVIMPASYKQKIRSVAGVKDLYISMWYGGTYKDQTADQRNNLARFAVEPEDFFKVQIDLEVAPEQKQAFLKERTACIIGSRLANKLDIKLGDRITLKGDIFPGNMELNVRGIFDDPLADETLFFNNEYLYQASLLAGEILRGRSTFLPVRRMWSRPFSVMSMRCFKTRRSKHGPKPRRRLPSASSRFSAM